MTTFTLARVIGNELPPRDTTGNRIKSLNFILENEFLGPECSTLWVLNQIYDKSLLRRLIGILKNQNFINLKFNYSKYHESNKRDEKIVNAININKARNLAINESNSDFVFIFDGDCFFNKECWNQTIEEIMQDQSKFNRQYYGIPGIRIVERIPENWRSYDLHEPSLVLRKDASMRFNESIPFSKSDKIEFLERLGYSKGNFTLDICRNVGRLLHISFNDKNTEVNLPNRMKLRDISIDILLNKLDKMVYFL